MTSVKADGFNCCLRHQLKKGGKESTGLEKAAKDVGGRINNLEAELQKMMNGGGNPGDVMAKENELKRAYMALETLSRVLQNRFQIMMQGIRALNVR